MEFSHFILLIFCNNKVGDFRRIGLSLESYRTLKHKAPLKTDISEIVQNRIAALTIPTGSEYAEHW
jgi:hypothetical protein